MFIERMARLTVDLPDQFLFRIDIPIRISDVNYNDHLGNDAVLSIAQEARLQMLKQYGYTELNIHGVGLIMADAAVIYRSEAFHGETLTVEVGLRELRSASFEMVYRMTEKSTGREVALVKTGMVFYNYETKKVARMPEQFRFWFHAMPPG